MDNPILVLIFWGVINLFIKSAKDKKRAEQARNKRPIQGSVVPTPQKPKPQSSKSIIDVFKDEIEKEIKREKEFQNKKTKPFTQEVKQKPVVPVNKQVMNPINDYLAEEEPEERMEVIRAGSISHKTSGKQQIFNSKKDILKGIIYSEILSEPKSVRNLKR